MKVKVDGKLFDFPSKPLELGEQRRLKKEFGFVPGRDDFDLRDPDHLGAFLYSALREAQPETPPRVLLEMIDTVREIDIVGDDGEPFDPDKEPEADPTPAANAATTGE